MIVKAEIPDLYTQFKLMAEFTSSDIQEASKGYPISDTFMLVQTTVQWFSSLDVEKIKSDRTYLIKAQIDMREEDFTRYDRIRFSESGDRFDPFTMGSYNPKNSYIGAGLSDYLGGGGHSSRGGLYGLHKKSNAAF